MLIMPFTRGINSIEGSNCARSTVTLYFAWKTYLASSCASVLLLEVVALTVCFGAQAGMPPPREDLLLPDPASFCIGSAAVAFNGFAHGGRRDFEGCPSRAAPFSSEISREGSLPTVDSFGTTDLLETGTGCAKSSSAAPNGVDIHEGATGG